ncbi:Protein arginine N-methyltransferase 5 [Thelohanellus kitauei]|uniref:Protein arginine N-methyltransferase 5 n=1 Tax=Thelohanellus kitauei TaxID=669202 RepID=A0A0C2MJ00_THEKT|nr:Protein arginine N-methyltransferase 5 [Thelohanellus kitauei]
MINVNLTSWQFDSPLDDIDLTRKMQVMRKELDYACHLSVGYITIKIGRFSNIQCISQILAEFHSQTKLRAGILIMAEDPTVDSHQFDQFLGLMISYFGEITLLCDNIKNISFGFLLGTSQIHFSTIESLLTVKWLSVIVCADNFHPNMKGVPILPKPMKGVIRTLFMHKNTKVIVRTPEITENISQYINYIRRVETETQNSARFDPFEHYEDVLQTPLQPLAKNLESFIYEVFESDPIKYQQYEKALELYFNDCVQKGKAFINLLLIGAGRGPLIDCVIRAAAQNNVTFHLVALEKNENAFPTELLGSFGDNELSPECLENANRFTTDETVFIPSSYTSYLCPVSAPVVHDNIGQFRGSTGPDPFQSPYVVYLYTSQRLSSPEICFTFEHYVNGSRYCGDRYKSIKFTANVSGIVHGFAGYFSATLYKDVCLSINPQSETPKMFSWLPFFFPIINPFRIEKGRAVTISIWRRTSSTYVWYEWCIDSPFISPIHNSAGKHFHMLLN